MATLTEIQEYLIIRGISHRLQLHAQPLPTQQIQLGFTELPLFSLCFLFISQIIADHSWEAPSVIQARLPAWLLGITRVCCSIDLPSCVLQ